MIWRLGNGFIDQVVDVGLKSFTQHTLIAAFLSFRPPSVIQHGIQVCFQCKLASWRIIKSVYHSPFLELETPATKRKRIIASLKCPQLYQQLSQFYFPLYLEVALLQMHFDAFHSKLAILVGIMQLTVLRLCFVVCNVLMAFSFEVWVRFAHILSINFS